MLRPADDIGEPRAGHQLARDDAPRRQLGHDRGHADRRVAGEVLVQRLLIGGLAPVIELFEHALPELGDQAVDVLARRGHPQHAAQQRDVVQVGRHHLGDARVLDLDRDRQPVLGDRPMYLADRRRGDGLGIPAGEQLLRRLAQLRLDDAGGQLRAHRRDAVLQPAQGAADRRCQALVDVAGHLAELDHDALHGAERRGHVVGGLHGQVVAELLPVLASGDEQARRAAGVAQTAADGELRGCDSRARSAAGRLGGGRAPARRRSRRCPTSEREQRAPQAPHARTAARIRRVMRCLASRTPGSPRNTASSTPSACRISSRRASVSSGAV